MESMLHRRREAGPGRGDSEPALWWHGVVVLGKDEHKQCDRQTSDRQTGTLTDRQAHS